MLKLTALTIFIPLFSIRWLRWLALVQQKEYRFDRLLAFASSEQGLEELRQVCPIPTHLSLTAVKRPKITPRVLVVAVLSGLLTAGIIVFAINRSFFWLVLTIGLLQVLLPLIVLLAALPTAIVFQLFSYSQQKKAQSIIALHQPRIIGITGSYGKTSTKLIVGQVLSQKFSVYVSRRSFNTRFSLAKDIISRYQGEELAVLEYAAYKIGEIKKMTRLFPPNLAVITGLTKQHLALFGSVQNIIRAKAELVASLPENGLCLLNGADQGTNKIARAGGAECVKYYSGKKSDLDLGSVSLDRFGRLGFEWEGAKVQTKLVGRHYLQSVRAAIYLGLYFQLDKNQIITALEEFTPPDFMIQFKRSKLGAAVIDDGFSTNPTGFAASLELLSELKANFAQAFLLTAGIVDLGEETEAIHLSLAQKARPIVDRVFYLGEVGREQFKQVFGSDFKTCSEDPGKAIDQLTESDILLLEGKTPAHVKNYLGV